MRGGGVPAGVNHRAANQILPSAMKAASQHISCAFGSDAYVFYTNSGLRPKKDFDVERKNFRRIAKYLTDASNTFIKITKPLNPAGIKKLMTNYFLLFVPPSLI